MENKADLQKRQIELESDKSAFEAIIATMALKNQTEHNGETIEDLRNKIQDIEQKLLNIKADLIKFKKFNREMFLNNLDYLLANSEVKLGTLETDSGNNPGYISRMKSGKSPSDPSIEFLMTVADQFNIPLEVLVSSRLSEMSATEQFVFDFLKKVVLETQKDTLTWYHETKVELEKLRVLSTEDGEYYINHPLYKIEREVESGGLYPCYNSLFYKNCGVEDIEDTYHAMLPPSNKHLYIAKCHKGDNRLPWKSDVFFEIYIVDFDTWGNPSVRQLCNTQELSSVLVSEINVLIKAILQSLTHVHLEIGVKNAITEFMTGKLMDDEELPFA